MRQVCRSTNNEKQRAEAPASAPRTFARGKISGFAIAEILVSITVLVVTVVVGTQALLKTNRRAATARLLNAAKAEALSRIQQVAQSSYKPEAAPAVVPSILVPGKTTQNVDLGSDKTKLGKIPGTLTWEVAKVGGDINLLSVRCTVNYKYMGRDLSYALFTFKSAD